MPKAEEFHIIICWAVRRDAAANATASMKCLMNIKTGAVATVASAVVDVC